MTTRDTPCTVSALEYVTANVKQEGPTLLRISRETPAGTGQNHYISGPRFFNLKYTAEQYTKLGVIRN